MGRYVDGLQFWSTVIGHIFSWPVAVVVSVVILRRSLGKLLNRLSSFSGPGDVAVTFSDVVEGSGIEDKPARGDSPAGPRVTPPDKSTDVAPAGEPGPRDPNGRATVSPSTASGRGSANDAEVKTLTSEDANLPPALARLTAEESKVRAKLDSVRILSFSNPDSAIREAWFRVEEALLLASKWMAPFYPAPKNADQAIELLTKLNRLPPERVRRILQLNTLRRVAKGGGDMTSVSVDITGAREYVMFAEQEVKQVFDIINDYAANLHKTGRLDLAPS